MSDEELGGLRAAAAYSNAFKTMAPDAWATGFRANEFRLRTLSHNNTRRVGEEFLINTRLLKGNRAETASITEYFMDIGVTLLSMVDRGRGVGRTTIELPGSAKLDMPIGEVIERRRSLRSYTGDPLKLDELAALCRSSAGVTGAADVTLQSGGTEEILFRAAPSGGGLYSIQLCFVALHVEGLDVGVYGYDPVGDQLVALAGPSAVEGVLGSFSVAKDSLQVESAGAIFLLVGRPWRAMRKYGDRGVRLMLMEAGGIAEHLNLAATCLGLASLDCSSVYDDVVNRSLEMDGMYEMLVHSVLVGSAA